VVLQFYRYVGLYQTLSSATILILDSLFLFIITIHVPIRYKFTTCTSITTLYIIHADSSRQRDTTPAQCGVFIRIYITAQLSLCSSSSSTFLEPTNIKMSQSTNINSTDPNLTNRANTSGADQPPADRPETNLPNTSNSHQDIDPALTDRGRRYQARSTRPAQSQSAAPSVNAYQTPESVSNVNTTQSWGMTASSAREKQIEDDRRVIQERVARNNGRTYDEIEAASIILNMAQRAEATEAELAQRRGWRRA